jgi:hypothetical protein
MGNKRNKLQMLNNGSKSLKKLDENTRNSFQNKVEHDLWSMCKDGKIYFDRIRKSPRTESVYAYVGNDKILRVSMHKSKKHECGVEVIIPFAERNTFDLESEIAKVNPNTIQNIISVGL